MCRLKNLIFSIFLFSIQFFSNSQSFEYKKVNSGPIMHHKITQTDPSSGSPPDSFKSNFSGSSGRSTIAPTTPVNIGMYNGVHCTIFGILWSIGRKEFDKIRSVFI